MNISAPAIQRPVATTLLTIALLMAGALAYMQLTGGAASADRFPGNFRRRVVARRQSGDDGFGGGDAAGAAVRAHRRRQPDDVVQPAGLDRHHLAVRSEPQHRCRARDVQAAINAARGYLPADLPSNPTYRKINPADSPVIILEMTSDAMTQDQMYDVADSIMGQKLSQVEGVGQVFVWGSSQPAVRIEANPQRPEQDGPRAGGGAHRGCRARTSIWPRARWQNGEQDVDDTGQRSAQEGQGLQKSDRCLSQWSSGQAERRCRCAGFVFNVNNAGSFNGKPSVLVVIFRQPGANIIATADRVIAALPFLKASLPPSIHLEIGLDRTTTVRASVTDVQRTLIISVVLVVLVVFVFLREVRATLIPSVAVPLAIVGTFGVMYLCGYSLNNLSLMALTISTGFVVDDAIVVLENVMRHVEAGMKPYQAALVGSREIGFTVVSMSTSLIAVFIPILLMGGIVGRLFREFAVTLSAAIAVSLVVSLTTTPMLCARFLKPHDAGKHGRLYRISERGFAHLTHGYKVSLGWVLRHRRLILVVAVLMVFVNVFLYIIVPKGFFPQQDTGRLAGMVMGDQDVSFEAMKAKTNELITIVRKDPAVENVLAFVGGNGAQNQGRVFIVLKPLNVRKMSADQVIARLRPKLSHVPGATLFLQSVQDLQIGGRQSNAQYQYTLSGEDLDELYLWAPEAAGETAQDSPVKRREQRSADQWPGRECGYRPNHGRAPGRYSPAD